MRCASICHCKNSNYQIDHTGSQHDCISRFEEWCSGNDVLWAHLFDERNGQQVATYNSVQGLTTLAYNAGHEATPVMAVASMNLLGE